ncbi:hypothetical protein QR680_018488 [Steinernema hermaphroditum]|uniref:Sphingomyelin phosphodiesterase n=1 Tax=Steinernema hermaphroditum TaxID=289476 RepID=A0AA39HI43_9BILA|nr:hypothetical protein QR680_018488 [Steinernema hermaphroditum]
MRSSLLLVALVAVFAFGYAAVIPAEEPTLNKGTFLYMMQKSIHKSKSSNHWYCFPCKVAVDAVQNMIKNGKTDSEIDDFLIGTCKALAVEQPYVCEHIIKAFSGEIYYTLERLNHSSEELCGFFGCFGGLDALDMPWNISIPDNKPAVKPWPTVPANKPTLRVLHLSDIHIDHGYVEGSEADCTNHHGPLNTYAYCCRAYKTDRPNDPVKVPAGKWGAPFKCDIPYRMFDIAMKQIAQKEPNLDYILITGDLESHNIWDYTRNEHTTNIENVTAALLEYFPNTKIYQAIGNHEGVPMDSMAPHTLPDYKTRGPQWLYSILANAWSNWIPKDAVKDVQYRASYSIRPFPGLKIISINTIYCSTFNFYIYLNQADPDGTMSWIIKELEESEKIGEKVHLISHIPNGADYCLKGWSENFYKVVNRFEDTIAAQFYGHTHQDHFQVFYENGDVNGRPTHFNWISPSLTTYSDNMPSYRIYTIDGNYEGSTYTVIDADTYYANLTEAYATGKDPEFVHEYNTREAYGMKDLSPASWNDLTNRFKTDDDLFHKFLQYYYRDHKDQICGLECRNEYVCDMKSAKSFSSKQFCNELI